MLSDARYRTRREKSTAARRGEHVLVKKRMEGVFLMFLLAVGALALRLGELQGPRSHGFIEMANRLQRRERVADAPRGRMLDRNGKLLATDVLGQSICLNPRLVQDPAATAAKLAEQLSLDEQQRALMQDKLARMKEKRSAYV